MNKLKVLPTVAKFDSETVRIVKILQTKKQESGKTVHTDIVDKQGHWVQIEYLTGANIGNLKPVTIEMLSNIDV